MNDELKTGSMDKRPKAAVNSANSMIRLMIHILIAVGVCLISTAQSSCPAAFSDQVQQYDGEKWVSVGPAPNDVILENLLTKAQSSRHITFADGFCCSTQKNKRAIRLEFNSCINGPRYLTNASEDGTQTQYWYYWTATFNGFGSRICRYKFTPSENAIIKQMCMKALRYARNNKKVISSVDSLVSNQ